jgi:hypothetical protein
MNRKGGVCLRKKWEPLIGSIKTFEILHQVHLVTQTPLLIALAPRLLKTPPPRLLTPNI